VLAKIVTAKPDKFDSVYEQLVKQYMDMGGTAVMEGKMAAYEEFYKK
jgi:putative aldouronate transport system substrate-binding protein